MRRGGKSQREHDHGSNRQSQKNRSQNREDGRIWLTGFPRRLQRELGQRYSLFHRRHPLLMNDLHPLPPAQMLHVKITNNAPRQRQRNHTIADCVAHFPLTSPLGQGVKASGCSWSNENSGPHAEPELAEAARTLRPGNLIALQSKFAKTRRKKQDYFSAHSRKRMNKRFGPVHCLWEHLRISVPTPPWRQPTAPWPPPPPCSRVLPWGSRHRNPK